MFQIYSCLWNIGISSGFLFEVYHLESLAETLFYNRDITFIYLATHLCALGSTKSGFVWILKECLAVWR